MSRAGPTPLSSARAEALAGAVPAESSTNARSTAVAPTGESPLEPPELTEIKGLRLLYVDDDVDSALVRLLELAGVQVHVAPCAREAVIMAIEQQYDAMMIDLHLPDMFGLSVVRRLRAQRIAAPMLVITGCYVEDEMERAALQAGAAAFRRKPLLYDDVAETLSEIVSRRPESMSALLSNQSLDDSPITGTAASRRLAQWISRVGPSTVPVFITGESGVGKELAARAVHSASNRRSKKLVTINCGAIPDGLVESELFGHSKGAFTGAVSDKPGLLEIAHGSSVFLDEIAELPLSMQARLLRALEDGEIRRVGETRTRHVDVRIIAATNRVMQEEIQSGRFREDLYFRLAVATYHIPPLRERREEIKPLALHWLRRLSECEGCRVSGISPEGIAALCKYRWPGNVRELRNVLEHSIIWANGPILTEKEICDALAAITHTTAKLTGRQVDVDDDCLATLKAHHWNRTAAARSLGIDRTTLWRRLKRIGAQRAKDKSV